MKGLKLCFSYNERDQPLQQKIKSSNHICHIVERLIPSTRPNPLILSILCNTRMSLKFNLHRLQLLSKQHLNQDTIHQQFQIHTNIKQIKSKVNFQHSDLQPNECISISKIHKWRQILGSIQIAPHGSQRNPDNNNKHHSPKRIFYS